MLLTWLLLVSAQLDPSRPAVPLGGDYWEGTEVKTGEVWGVADLHAHFFNYLGFGGRVMHGTPSAPNGIRQALRNCRSNHGEDARGKSTAILPEPTHRTGGYPNFEGWPRYDTSIHQQAYVDWIRRAWQGGVRLVQVDVQNTPFLGKMYATANRHFVKGNLTPVALDDASALELQVGAARLFFNDGPASDFAAIAYSAADARRIIRSGKMAIVLGLEVESPGNFALESQLGEDPRKTVNALVSTLWEAGVRHVIPIHLTRNAFGHPAVFNPTLNAMNFADTGEFYKTTDAFDAGVRFDLARASGREIAGVIEFAGRLGGKEPFPQTRAVAASEGLTDAGVIFVEALMRKGFIVDVEHMSARGVDETLAMAVKAKVPVISSHADFRDLSFGTRVSWPDGGSVVEVNPIPFAEDKAGTYGTSDALKVRSERSRTVEQLKVIRGLGGVIGIQLVSRGVGVSWRDRVPLDCDATSKGFLQMLAYGEELMGTVAIASDVGGFATMPGPRFGPEACPGARGDAVRSSGGRVEKQVSAQGNRVRYEGLHPLTPTLSPSGERELSPSFAGKRTFDVNVDGVAHYGMIPDFFQDSANVARAAGAPELVPPLFRSAEMYLQMWERLEGTP